MQCLYLSNSLCLRPLLCSHCSSDVLLLCCFSEKYMYNGYFTLYWKVKCAGKGCSVGSKYIQFSAFRSSLTSFVSYNYWFYVISQLFFEWTTLSRTKKFDESLRATFIHCAAASFFLISSWYLYDFVFLVFILENKNEDVIIKPNCVSLKISIKCSYIHKHPLLESAFNIIRQQKAAVFLLTTGIICESVLAVNCCGRLKQDSARFVFEVNMAPDW